MKALVEYDFNFVLLDGLVCQRLYGLPQVVGLMVKAAFFNVASPHLSH